MPVDPAIIAFGFGIGMLVGVTGMGGGSLMTPLLILVFGIKPTVAIGTDISYAAITKSAGAWQHLRLGTVDKPLMWWLAAGSVPSAVAGVWVIHLIQARYGEGVDTFTLTALGVAVLVTGLIVLGRSTMLNRIHEEREEIHLTRGQKAAAVALGATTGFVIGVTSAGSGTLIAVGLIAIYKLAPKRIVGTDIAHAAILLWAAALAHVVSGNVDFALAGTILIGSVPGILIGSRLSVRMPTGALRAALGAVLVASGLTLLNKAGLAIPLYVPAALAAGFAVAVAVSLTRRARVRRRLPRIAGAGE